MHEGGCLCGAVRYAFYGDPTYAGNCHCPSCQRAVGAGFVTWVGAKPENFEVTTGQITYCETSPGVQRGFCGRCGSSMFCNADNHENVIDITVANLHGELDREPKAHVYYDCRASWLTINDELKKLGGASGTEPL